MAALQWGAVPWRRGGKEGLRLSHPSRPGRALGQLHFPLTDEGVRQRGGALFRHPCAEALASRSRRAVSWQPPFATPLGSTLKATLSPGSIHRVPSHFCLHRVPLEGIFTPEHPTGLAKTSSVPQSEVFPASFCFLPSFLFQVLDPHLARGCFSPNAILLTPLPFTASPREPLAHLTPSQCLPPGNPNTAQASAITLSLETETLRDYPGGPEARSACPQCKEPMFNPWSRK